MNKIIFSIITFSFLFLKADANEIDKYISQTDFNLKSTVSIYVEDEKDGNIIYSKNEQKLLNPASILKTLTFGASYLVLGEKYKFETAIYKDDKNNYYVKLGADTLFTKKELNKIVSALKGKTIENIYIDDTIIDKTPYPQSWMQEDIWPHSRAITPYIIDNNTTQILIKRSSLATKVDIIQTDEYKIPIINELKISDTHNIKIKKLYGENSSIISLQGTVSKDEIINLPVINPEINFNIKLQSAIAKNDIKYPKTIVSKKTPANATKITSISHTIENLSKPILHNSDNFTAEVVFRVAAAKYLNYTKSATLEDAIEMFNNIFEKQCAQDIKIADASGVSRYNLISSKCYCDILKELFQKTNLKDLMATSNEGTLKDRMPFLENNLRAKTGTLSQISSIAGALKTKSGRDVDFIIITQNSPKRKAVLKNFENTIIGIIYKKY